MMTPAQVYYGTAQALRAEIGLLPCYSEKYQIVAFGPNGEEFTPEGTSSKREMLAIVAEWRATFPSAEFLYIA